MNVILLHSGHRHVSATHVTIFRVMRTRIQYSYNVSKSLHIQKSYIVWLKFISGVVILISGLGHHIPSQAISRIHVSFFYH